MNFEHLCKEVEQWSKKTFGPREGRGPIGPLNHIIKEIKTELLPSEDHPNNDPADITELADVAILLADVLWRAGHLPQDVMREAFIKMEINKRRHYPLPIGDAVCEHDRSLDKR